jgi:glycosyltransferase involved in cell wall biosynthesis
MSDGLGPAVIPIQRILHLQTDTGLSGGVAGYISTLVKAPSLAHAAQLVVVPGASENAERCRAMYGDASVVAELPATYSGLGLFAYVSALQRIVLREQIDVIHAHALRAALPAAIVAKRIGVPLVYTNHGLRFTQKAGRIASRVFRLMESYICERASAVVAIRPFDTRVLQREKLVPVSRLHTIETRISAPLERRTAGVDTSKPIVIGVGSLIQVKRPDRFIKWLTALNRMGISVSAQWAGDGPLRATSEEAVIRAKLPMAFLGQLDRTSLSVLYGHASVLWLTSEFEVFPLAVLEAAANGVPVVSGRFDGIEDIIDANVTGVLVDADDADASAAAVAELLADEPLRQRLGQAARARFQTRFADPDIMAHHYAQLYASVIEPPQPAH